MKFNIVSGAAAIALALTTAAAFAQPQKASQPSIGDGSNWTPAPGPYYGGTGAASIGDGSSPTYLKDQQQLLKEPGYSVGGGTARIGDGSNTAPAPYAYNVGSGSAQIGDGSNSGPVPGPYYSGTGSARVGDGSNSGPVPAPYYSGTGSAPTGATGQYDQGSAQSLGPSNSEAEYAQTGPPG